MRTPVCVNIVRSKQSRLLLKLREKWYMLLNRPDKGVLLLFVVSFLASSCINDSQPEQHIEGTWQWERTYGGFFGTTTHADSVDYSMELKIDISKKEAINYKDGVITNRYNLKFEYSDWEDGKAWHMYPKEEENPAIILIIEVRSKNKIAVKEYCYDCYTSYYVR